MIVKIQRPLWHSEGRPECLIYNEDRTATYNTVAQQVFDLFEEDEYKIYHHARLHKDGQLEILERVPDEAW